jgi:hypothetical protein
MVQVAVDYPVSLIRCAARNSNRNPLFRSMLLLSFLQWLCVNTVLFVVLLQPTPGAASPAGGSSEVPSLIR